MCFSATASFVTSGGLAVIGAATLAVAPKKRRFLALIPFGFALQQAFEGIRWLTQNQGTLCTASGYGFVFIAFSVWPVLIPGAVFFLDRAGRSRVVWFLGLGVAVALSFFIALLAFPLSVTMESGTIVYDLGLGAIVQPILILLYIIAVCGSLLASRVRAFNYFGVLVFVSALVSYIWFREGFPSVWCFFAAIISGLVFFYAHVQHRKRSTTHE